MSNRFGKSQQRDSHIGKLLIATRRLLEIFETGLTCKISSLYHSNQIEKHYPDGTKEIIFPDETVKYLYQSGAEECVFADGTVERISEDGSRIVEFPNGQRETYTKLFKV